MKTMYIILSFCIGLLAGYILFHKKCNQKAITSIPSVDSAKNQLQIIVSDKRIYDLRFKHLKDSLSKKLSLQSVVISSQKKALIQSREHLKQIVFQLKTDSFANRDTVLVDSLSFELQQLHIETDTLVNSYESEIKLYHAMVAVRDSEIVLNNKAFIKLKDFSNERLLREQELTNNLNTALKALRRKKLQNKLLAGGMLFISGVTTVLFIKARQ